MNNNNIEIERRWLMRKLPNELADEAYTILQYYSPLGRYRSRTPFSQTEEKNFDTTPKYFHTIKRPISTGINSEFEVEITKEQFDIAIKLATKSLTKLRFVYNYQGLAFEVDLMLNTTYQNKFHCDLIILEVELQDYKQNIEFPYCIENRIIKEITGENEYSNYSLAKDI